LSASVFVQGVYNKIPHLEDVLKIGKCFLGVNGLLIITGVQIPA
jgi:hypothetical protein